MRPVTTPRPASLLEVEEERNVESYHYPFSERRTASCYHIIISVSGPFVLRKVPGDWPHHHHHVFSPVTVSLPGEGLDWQRTGLTAICNYNSEQLDNSPTKTRNGPPGPVITPR